MGNVQSAEDSSGCHCCRGTISPTAPHALRSRSETGDASRLGQSIADAMSSLSLTRGAPSHSQPFKLCARFGFVE